MGVTDENRGDKGAGPETRRDDAGPSTVQDEPKSEQDAGRQANKSPNAVAERQDEAHAKNDPLVKGDGDGSTKSAEDGSPKTKVKQEVGDVDNSIINQIGQLNADIKFTARGIEEEKLDTVLDRDYNPRTCGAFQRAHLTNITDSVEELLKKERIVVIETPEPTAGGDLAQTVMSDRFDCRKYRLNLRDAEDRYNCPPYLWVKSLINHKEYKDHVALVVRAGQRDLNSLESKEDLSFLQGQLEQRKAYVLILHNADDAISGDRAGTSASLDRGIPRFDFNQLESLRPYLIARKCDKIEDIKVADQIAAELLKKKYPDLGEGVRILGTLKQILNKIAAAATDETFGAEFERVLQEVCGKNGQLAGFLISGERTAEADEAITRTKTKAETGETSGAEGTPTPRAGESERALHEKRREDGTLAAFFAPAERAAEADEIIIRTILGVAVILPRLPTSDFVRVVDVVLNDRGDKLALRFHHDLNYFVENRCRLSFSNEGAYYKYVDFCDASDARDCRNKLFENQIDRLYMYRALTKAGIVFEDMSHVLLDRLCAFYARMAEVDPATGPETLLATFFGGSRQAAEEGHAVKGTATRHLARLLITYRQYRSLEGRLRRFRTDFVTRASLEDALSIADELAIVGEPAEELAWIEDAAVNAKPRGCNPHEAVVDALWRWLARHPDGSFAGLVDLVPWLQQDDAGGDVRRAACLELFSAVFLGSAKQIADAMEQGEDLPVRRLFRYFVMMDERGDGKEARKQLSRILSGLFERAANARKWWSWRHAEEESEESRLAMIASIVFYWHLALTFPAGATAPSATSRVLVGELATNDTALKMRQSGLWTFIVEEVIRRLGPARARSIQQFFDEQYALALAALAIPEYGREDRVRLRQHVTWWYSFRKEYYNVLRGVSREKRWYRGEGQAEAVPASAGGLGARLPNTAENGEGTGRDAHRVSEGKG